MADGGGWVAHRVTDPKDTLELAAYKMPLFVAPLRQIVIVEVIELQTPSLQEANQPTVATSCT